MKKLVLMFVLASSFGYADSGYTLVSNSALSDAHAWERMGTSFALQSVCYGLSKRVLRMDRTDAVIFSLMATMLFTTVYSIANNPTATNAQIGHDILMNGVGAGLSAGATFLFEF